MMALGRALMAVAACALAIVAGPALAKRPPAANVAAWVGTYADGQALLDIRERDGALFITGIGPAERPLRRQGRGYVVADGDIRPILAVTEREGVRLLSIDGRLLPRRDVGAEVQAGIQAGVRADIEAIRARAMQAAPPVAPLAERGEELVNLVRAVPGILLDIRYATTDNFMGVVLYERPAAFLQRPAAEALARAAATLRQQGYGILVHDAYRPWHVTRMFWDATPESSHVFVADPAQGSRHNRGCAVDLTLYRLRDGAPVEMPSRYDEMSTRSHADYAGGTSRQRWERDLLRRAMEQEGFTVLPEEWWHFDFADWPKYGVLNIPLGDLLDRGR